MIGHCKMGGDCFGLKYFLEGHTSQRKIPRHQNNHPGFHTITETKMVQSYYIMSLITAFSDISAGTSGVSSICVHIPL